MKIAIIGYSGSGKSTLARQLSNHYSIPKLHMDRLQFQPGWKDSDRDWMSEQMDNFLSKIPTGLLMATTLGVFMNGGWQKRPNHLSELLSLELPLSSFQTLSKIPKSDQRKHGSRLPRKV